MTSPGDHKFLPLRSESDPLEDSWPEPDQQLFVSTSGIHGARLAADPAERLWRMVRGFKTAADLLVEETERTPHQRSDLVYPIVYSYRHSLELAFKQLLASHADNFGVGRSNLSHELQGLWQSCRKIIERASPEDDRHLLETITNLVAEFAAADATSQNFRYATSPKGQRISLSLNAIELVALRSTLAGVHNFLDVIDTVLTEVSDQSWQ